jgi:flagellar hook-length control protein FliK
VRLAVLQGGDRVTVQLEPEALGKVQVLLVRGDEGIRASFRVENPLTQQALQADAPMLKQALEARGVNVAHVSVELEQGDRQNRDPLARHHQGRRRRFGSEEDGEMPLDELTLRPQQWRPWGFEARA